MSQTRLRILFCDHLNLARGKYLPGPHDSDGESRFCQGIYALTYHKELIPAPHSTLLDGLPDMIARYRKPDIRAGWDGHEVVIADQFDSSGNPLPMSGRHLLKRSVNEWLDMGYTPKVGIELEAYAYTFVNNEWVLYDTPGAFVYSTGPFSDPVGFTDAIWKQAEECGFPLEMITTEFDSPQFEFTLRYDDAMAAADTVFLFRLMAREVAFKHGILLTFMPKPAIDLSGSGVHVNFSLWNKDGVNEIGDPESEFNLSKIGRGCVAGLIRHHRSLSALLAPTVNSYTRLQPASLSGYWRNWGVDHRGVTTRITSETGDHARIEHRMADGAANTYTMIAGILQAALLGCRNDYPLQAAETSDCLESHDAEDGVPENLGEALDALMSDTELVCAVGQELVENLEAIKRSEIQETAGFSERQLRNYYLYYL